MTNQPLERFEGGRAAFNRGDFFDAHELWEQEWLALEGAERVVLQGLIQIAAGLHHLQEHRPRQAATLIRKGVEKLFTQPAAAVRVHPGLHALGRNVARLLTNLETPGATLPDPTRLRL